MHEKLSKYMPPNVRCQWPLTAYTKLPMPSGFLLSAMGLPKCCRWFDGSFNRRYVEHVRRS